MFDKKLIALLAALLPPVLRDERPPPEEAYAGRPCERDREYERGGRRVRPGSDSDPELASRWRSRPTA